MSDKFLAANRSLWDELTAIHLPSDFYDVAGFRNGQSSLKPVELAEVGDVRGKSLLHLQCHFGLDTLSWGRLGAQVTGIDFSDVAISAARALSQELAIPATFIRSDIYDLHAQLTGRFDIVYTSYGVLCWLPDLARWAQMIANYLKPGGAFYIVEFHPFAYMLGDDGVTFKYPYFNAPQPLRLEGDGDYATPIKLQHISYEWPHPISETVNALINAGLRLEFIHEFPFSSYQYASSLEETEPHRSHLKHNPSRPPLMFSIRATREGKLPVAT